MLRTRTQLARPSLAVQMDVPSALPLALVTVALMAAVSWAVLAAGWVVQGGGGAVVVAMAAAAEAALLAQAHVRRWLALVLAPVLALAAIIPTTLGTMPYDGDGSLGHTVVRYAGALTGGLMASSDWAFTVGLCGVLWVTGYWLAWLALRERQGVLAVLPLYAILATNVLNERNPNATALPVVIAAALSLCVIAATHLEALQTRWQGVRVASLPRTRSRFAATVIVAVGVLTAVALLVPPATTADISARLFPGSKPGTGAQHGGQVGTIEFSTGTVPGGALVSHPQQVLTYSTDSAEPVYLSVVDDTQFVAGNWYPGQGGVQPAPGVTFNGLGIAAGTLPRDLSAVDGTAIGSATTVHADLIVQPGATGSTGYALFTGEPTAVDHSGTAFGLTSTARRGALLTVDVVQLSATGSAPLHLHTAGLVSNATEDQLRAAGTAYPPFLLQYKRLPDDMTHGAAAIADLAKRWTAGTDNPYDAATAIEEHLRDPRNFQYSLTPTAAPSGMWPVVYFLTQSHQGYCQYFASAMGAMLRSLGIPTRLVNGYGPGSPLTAAGGRSGARVQQVTTSDAHTWVEAFFPGYGWIPFEPTPSSAQGAYTPIPRGAAGSGGAPTPAAAPTPDPAGLRPGFAEPGTNGSGGSATGGVPTAAVVGLVAAGLAALLACYALWLFLPRSPRAVWRRLETVGILRGVRRRLSETHCQYAERLGDVHPDVAAPARELAALIARSEFSGAPLDRDADRRALALWRTIAAATPRLLTRRRAHAA